MKNLFLSALTLIFFACNSSSEPQKTEVEMGNNMESDITAICNCDELEENDEKLLQLNGTIYTGNCFLNYPNSDEKYIEKQILNGKVHGKIAYFDKNGGLLFEETYNDGNLVGDLENSSVCDCSDIVLDKSDGTPKYYLNDILYTGSCEDYYPNSEQLYLESNYKDGQLDGFTIYYQKDGSVLMMQNYKEGVLLEDIIPQD